ncbi:hypothetical protein Baya_13864 [Bagarius yarrelli]|uniref:Uncharacterized protein n=1 Tax=Bagarius yarrelli TaxID=175774 RepID=A0A556V879_BAGYA|nr:hypothetical protein Baya_13864 [Bagarius yarrelli]
MDDDYLGDINGYQSDQPTMIGSRLAMLRLRHLSPSVQCDNDSMLLHIKGSQVPKILVETSEGPVPLSQMPSSCGYSVRRARRDLSLGANYDCCNVQQQGNTYILPLSFSGLKVKVVCPMARPRTTVFCSSSAMVANLPESLEVLRLKVFCLEMLLEGKLWQSGSLAIGSIGSNNESEDGVFKKMPDEHLGDMNGYQADQPAVTEGSRLAMSRLRRLSPSVRCANESMSLHLKGSQVPNFLVETSKDGPKPLSRMPSSCGYSVRRARRDLSLTANYDCCNVQQQGHTYILPLSFSGLKVKVVCPMARPRTTVFCSSSAMVANLPDSLEVLRLKAPTCGFTWETAGDGLILTAPYSSQCWHVEGAERRLSVQYTGVELTLSCPAVATSLDGLKYHQACQPSRQEREDLLRPTPSYPDRAAVIVYDPQRLFWITLLGLIRAIFLNGDDGAGELMNETRALTLTRDEVSNFGTCGIVYRLRRRNQLKMRGI